jgi:diguanylate cyclase (GGDEF)-like protein
MKQPDLRHLRSPDGLRLIALFAAAAVLPVALLAAWLTIGPTPASHEGTALALALVLAAGAALALGVALGARQARRLVHQVDALSECMRRVGQEQFPVSLAVGGSGEYARLAHGFNEMARELGAKRAAMGLLAQMDESLLSKVDLRDLVNSALTCMSQVTRAQIVALVVFDVDGRRATQIFQMRRGERSRVERIRTDGATEFAPGMPLSPVFETCENAPLPPQVIGRLRKEDGVRHFLTLPLSHGERSWGALVACYAESSRLGDAQAQLLAGIGNRLIAGFRSTEREKKLHSLAFVDRLTRLPNRAAFQAMLPGRLEAAQRDSRSLAVLFIDLDRFKQVNEAHGHEVGDRVIKEVAKRIRGQMIDTDVVARVGGDKFSAIMSHVGSRRDAARFARTLIQAVSQPLEIDGRTIYTGASIGIAVFPECGGQDLEPWKMAEAAMYRAKGDGRSRLAFYEKRMNAQSKRRSRLDTELREALKRDELVVHYQPQIDLHTGKLCGVEALVRWQHPSRGLISPAEFIDDAEQIGLIPQLGMWVLREACLQHRRWRAEGVDIPRISVNASSGQLPRSNFVQQLRQVVAATGLPAGVLELEVTESMLVAGGDAAINALNQLAADGIQIAIDDFGTGYSSFNYLRTMPAQVLKLDMSFIVEIRADNDAGKIVAAMINMAHALHKVVVAEGIERADQLLLLKKLGCDRGQGYLLGKPVVAEAIARTYAGTWHGERPRPIAAESDPRLQIALPARSEAPSPHPLHADAWNDEDMDEQLTVPRIPPDSTL